MSWWRRTAAVIRFEMRRSATWPRLALWTLVTLFPVAVIGSLRASLERLPDPRIWVFALYFLVTEFATCLGMILCIAPSIQVELEQRSWVYLAVRPYGRRTVLVGKYLWALLATTAMSWVALVPAVWLAYPPNRLHTYAVLAVLCVLSAAGRGAAYAVLAVAFPHRAMVFAVAYTLIVEFIVGWIPALINQFTVQFHVRCLLMRWMGLQEWVGGLRMFFDDASPYRHLGALVLYTAVVLCAAVIWVENRSFVSSEEG